MNWPWVVFQNLGIHSGCCLCGFPCSCRWNPHASRSSRPSLVRLPRLSGFLPFHVWEGASLCSCLAHPPHPIELDSSSYWIGFLNSPLYDQTYPSHTVSALSLYFNFVLLVAHIPLSCIYRYFCMCLLLHLFLVSSYAIKDCLMNFLILLLSSIKRYMLLNTHQVLIIHYSLVQISIGILAPW